MHNIHMNVLSNFRSINLHSYAKINLLLDVLYKRMDGYHELRTVMQSVSVYDSITVTVDACSPVRVICSTPLPERNTASRAAELFIRRMGCENVRIEIKKGIPAQAGMGGASADAAGVLRAMQLLFGGVDDAELYRMGRSIGADVPFCLHGGCALAEGVGERLTALRSPRMNLLIVMGRRGVPTGELFNALGLSKTLPREYTAPALASGDCDALLLALDRGDIGRIASNVGNALTEFSAGFAPEIRSYIDRMQSCGAIASCMTGSGSAVYGIFPTMEDAKRAAKSFSDCAFALPCSTVDVPYQIIHEG